MFTARFLPVAQCRGFKLEFLFSPNELIGKSSYLHIAVSRCSDTAELYEPSPPPPPPLPGEEHHGTASTKAIF